MIFDLLHILYYYSEKKKPIVTIHLNSIMTMHQTQETTLRKDIFDGLRLIFKMLPDATQDIWHTVTTGLVGENVLVKLYNDLSEFLESFPEYSRIIFYIPIELLPDASRTEMTGPLGIAALRFVTVYRKHWNELLHIHDVRANFINGDVPEKELYAITGQLPRISKAAHLVPALLRKAIISRTEIEALWETSDNILRATLAEVLELLDHDANPVKEVINDPFTDLTAIDRQFVIDNRDLTTARADWLKADRIRNLIECNARHIVEVLDNGGELERFATLLYPDAFSIMQRIGIRTLTLLGKTHDVSERFTPALLALWDMKDPAIRDAIEVLISHWSYLGIISKGNDLRVHTQVPVPSFDNFFIEPVPGKESLFAELERLALSITSDEVARYVYPVIIAYGSQIKGYGAPNADVDIAVFIRPDTDWSKKDCIRKRLRELLVHEKIRSAPLEFWMEDTENGIGIKSYDATSNDNHIGDTVFIHILLQCPWLGDNDAIDKLRTVAINSYINIDNPKQRSFLAESLEHDVIQYRLLHKGYARLFPEQFNAITDRAADAPSTFWDSGFRRLATLLYINKVMVPRK